MTATDAVLTPGTAFRADRGGGWLRATATSKPSMRC